MDSTEGTRNYLFYQVRKKQPFIQKANEIYMWDQDGKKYIDGCSGAMICNIGYGHSRIQDAIVRQAKSTFFAYRLHFENEPSPKLAEELVERHPIIGQVREKDCCLP